MLFYVVYRFSPSVVLRALAGAAFLAYAAYSVVRFVKKRITYELYNAPRAMEEELFALVDAFVREHALDASTAQLSNKQTYRIMLKEVPHRDARALLKTVNKAISAHGKLSIATLIELFFLVVLGGLLYVWLRGVCLLGLIG